MVIARSVSGPVRTLAAGVQNIERGDYGHRVNVLQQDEFGDLGRAFNSMAVGLEERDRVRSLLGKVVSPEIAEELLTRGVALGGEDREVTILFSDVRNFTTMSEKQTPQAVLNLLNTYLEGMSAVIDRHDGVVDKYIGDAIMALFGAPLQHEDDADRALSCAVEMIEALAAVNVKLKEDGFPRLDIGIGINTAVVVAGNMGSSNRLNYTVIGDGVNLAARLESACKQYGAHILVSEFTMAKLRGTYCNREVDKVVVKGKTEPLGIFEILGYHTEETFPNLVEALNHFNGGLELYREAKWDAAMDSFRNVLDLNPKDRLSETYIERCRYLKANPPEDEWDGIWVMTSK
jgi:adenylate cyclase